MKSFPLMVACTAALALAGYATTDLLREGMTVSQAPVDRIDQASRPHAKATYDAARQLAWQAAVSVQGPPHEIATWQQARVTWRKAMRLLESIPADSDLGAIAKTAASGIPAKLSGHWQSSGRRANGSRQSRSSPGKSMASRLYGPESAPFPAPLAAGQPKMAGGDSDAGSGPTPIC